MTALQLFRFCAAASSIADPTLSTPLGDRSRAALPPSIFLVLHLSHPASVSFGWWPAELCQATQHHASTVHTIVACKDIEAGMYSNRSLLIYKRTSRIYVMSLLPTI
jgi:hypothetical protein